MEYFKYVKRTLNTQIDLSIDLNSTEINGSEKIIWP